MRKKIVSYEDNYQKFLKKINRLNKKSIKEFRKIPIKERFIFISHCLLPETIKQIEETAKKLGYENIYQVKGGSIIKKIIAEKKPLAVIGVACYNEIKKMGEALMKDGMNLPALAVLLSQDGCENTTVDLELVNCILAT